MTKERVCANGPTLSRRTLLTALPATGVALAVPRTAHGGNSAPVDRHPEWLASYDQSRGAWAKISEDSPEEAQMWAVGDRFQELICHTPARSSAGLNAQMKFLIRECKHYWPGDDIEALAQTILHGLESGEELGIPSIREHYS
ncbi:hypothetical protein [Loktanella sp. 3ANDIMAR09]|uniref:hypothetical protein n=1 Tax=Loktanella sp. 3ANDIMAR09 TaxID=1225657 RepID=UPI000B04889E|nr:hypothetical protein [Loktanella sp. 3ANDIMAR09]